MRKRNALTFIDKMGILLCLTISTVYGFDPKDLEKLKITKQCPKCDLSNADLSGAIRTDGTICKKGSIGECKK
jgi:hypothetical protein